jgi:hypothetical protein
MSANTDLVHATRLQLFISQVTYALNAVLEYHRGTNTLRPWGW